MKFEALWRNVLCTLVLGHASLWVGCSSNEAQLELDKAQHAEIERLQAENLALDQVRAENVEVKRLRVENQELPKARSQYQEAGRLKKENEQLRQQVAKLASARGAAAASPAAQGASSAVAGPVGGESAAALAAGNIDEGDEILVEPKYLKELLPEFDWEKMDRKEPLSVRPLLEKDGILITNVSQILEFGLTNYTVRKAARTAPAQEPAVR